MSPGLPGTLIGTLLDWYDENGRHSFPWREPDRSAFEILIAEILLQKTTATAVSGAYVPLIARYPTPESFVAAPSDEIEDRISSLGLSKRTEYIQRCSGQLLDRHSGNVPRTEPELLELHGVGEYTARSVLIHTGEEGFTAVDTNVERLLSRYFDFDPDERDIQALADEIVPSERGSDFLHAMLDFAAAVCTARSPGCGDCQLEGECGSSGQFETRDSE